MQLKSPDLSLDSKNNIENDFFISLNHNDLPIPFLPYRINFCMVCVCLSGYAEIEIDLIPYHFVNKDIIIVFPGQILDCYEKSSDFMVSYFSFANHLVDEILYRLPSAFIGFLKETVKYQLPETEKDLMFTEYFSILHSKFCNLQNVCRGEIIINLLHNFYLDLYNKVIIRNEIHTRQRKRKKELQEEFFRLVKLHTDNREVAFYAGKLCITPKYLSIIAKESTGTSAKELIDKIAITELKLQLKSSSSLLKEIAVKLDYPCEAFLCKYFKKHTGITPSHFRNMSR
ncbi:MAG: AraC family transcriptional regulator [Bacteroidetes bacterium]|nr:AraC family transcriptional regulator [Bacteroidota bacterium]